MEEQVAKKRGRKPMTESEKESAKLKRLEKKNEVKAIILTDVDIFNTIQDLQKQIKKNIDKLSASDVNKVKSLLNMSVMQIDVTLTDKIVKEKAAKKAKLEKELEQIQKELSLL